MKSRAQQGIGFLKIIKIVLVGTDILVGADMLIGKDIKVSLVTPSSDFTRRPVAHTCGCVLELPNTYTSYVDLRNYFNVVLKSDVWSMDII